MAAAKQPPRHVAAHAAQPDHGNVHQDLLARPGPPGDGKRPLERRGDQLGQAGEARRHVVAEAHTQGTAVMRPQGRQVAASLGALEHAEAVRLARDLDIVGVVPQQLQDKPRLRPPLWSWPVEWRYRWP